MYWRITALAFLFVALLGSSSRAAINLFNDFDPIGVTIGEGQTYTGSFNIATGDGDFGDISGFQPGVDNALFGVVEFSFLGFGTVSVDLDNILTGTTSVFFAGLQIDFLGTAALNSLNQDGILAYTLSLADDNNPWTNNKVGILQGNLSITAQRSDPPVVPEPTTFAIWSLLGATCLGYRKYRKKK